MSVVGGRRGGEKTDVLLKPVWLNVSFPLSFSALSFAVFFSFTAACCIECCPAIKS